VKIKGIPKSLEWVDRADISHSIYYCSVYAGSSLGIAVAGLLTFLSMVIFGLAERLHWIESSALPEIAVAIIDGIVRYRERYRR
jgi:hypothetical protein